MTIMTMSAPCAVLALVTVSLAAATSQAQSSDPSIERPVLTLSEARDILREQNYDMLISQQNLEEAALIEDQARAAVLPTLNLVASYTFRDREIEFEQGNVYAPLLPYLETVYQTTPALQQFFEDNPEVADARNLAAAQFEPVIVQFRHDYRASLTLTQTIFDVRAFTALRLAEVAVERSEMQHIQVEYELQGALQALYFDAVTYHRFIEASQRNIELARLGYERSVAAFEEEVGNRFEVTRNEVALRKAERDLENAHLAYELSLDALRTFLDLDQTFDVGPPPALDPPTDYTTLVDQGLASRPELSVLDRQIDLDRRRVDEARRRFWPVLSAEAQGTVVRESAFSGDAFSWTLGLLATWDLWDGGFRRVDRRSFEVATTRDELRLQQTRTRIESEVRQQWLQLQSQQRVVESARAEAELAQLNFDLTEEARDLGAATQLEVEVAQQQLFLSELTLADSEVKYQALVYELYRLGGDLR